MNAERSLRTAVETPASERPAYVPQFGPGAIRIDFETALSLAAGQNPRVAFANERIREAYARQRQAEVLWLPTINAGVNYNKHEGTIQDVEGNIIETSRGSVYAGLGARAVGAASPATPGLIASFHLRDAVFQPRVEESATAARQWAAQATLNDTLLDVAVAYLDLLEASERRAIAEETHENARMLAEVTAAFAETGQGNQADADRAQVELSLRANELLRAAEATQVASARLVQLLSGDPGVPLTPAEPSVARVDLVSLDIPLAHLVETGLVNRPELSESQWLVCEALQRLRRERQAVWLPSLLLGMSYGGNGGGLGNDIVNFDDRWDFDVAAWWQVRNLGFGEEAARDEARSQLSQAQFRQVDVMDRVAREIAEAHAQIQARASQIETARRAVQAALDSYDRNLRRIRDAQGLPIEVLQALQALDQARREYLRAITEYNEAQFRLHRAIGWPTEPAGLSE